MYVFQLFEVFFGKTLKFTLANFGSGISVTQTSTKSILGSAFQNVDVTLTFQFLKDSIFSVDVTGF